MQVQVNLGVGVLPQASLMPMGRGCIPKTASRPSVAWTTSILGHLFLLVLVVVVAATVDVGGATAGIADAIVPRPA